MDLPENVGILAHDEVYLITEAMLCIKVDRSETLGDFYSALRRILPHQGHDICLEECGFLIDRELTALLWAAFQAATYIHVNDFKFDRSHFFLFDLISLYVNCARSADNSCIEHRSRD